MLGDNSLKFELREQDHGRTAYLSSVSRKTYCKPQEYDNFT